MELFNRMKQDGHPRLAMLLKNRRRCRFDFPRIPLVSSTVAFLPQAVEEVMPKHVRLRIMKDIRGLPNSPDSSDMTAHQFYDRLNIPLTDVQLLLDSTVTYPRHFPARRPRDAMTNPFHPLVARILKSNMDIQAPLHSMQVLYYLAKYVARDEPTRQDEARGENREPTHASDGTTTGIVVYVKVE